MDPAQLPLEYLPIDRLVPDSLNPRRMSDAEQASLRRSIRAHGFVQPVVARLADHRIIGGHQRVVAARAEGITVVPVILVDVTEEQAAVLALGLNRISGSWDDELLARLLADLQLTPDVDLGLTGFTDDEVGTLLRSLETRELRDRPETFDVDAAVEAAGRSARTATGERWRCGVHDLLVGDATDQTALDRLLDGRRAAMVFADPPYNVGMGDHGGQGRGSRRRRITNDVLDPAAWEAFGRGWAGPMLAATDGALYVCMSGKEWPVVSRILAEAGGHWSTTIIWSKDRFTLGRADYQRSYEPVWYGWREGADHYWCGDRDQGDVWAIPRPSESPLHPTMKPLALMERAMANSSRPGELVLDPFVGSGSTIIAAERTGRRCAAMEIDPKYADVAIARWEAFTGAVAERIDE